MKKYNYLFLCFLLFAPIVTKNVSAMENEIVQRTYPERFRDIFAINEDEVSTAAKTPRGELFLKISRYLNPILNDLGQYDSKSKCSVALKLKFRNFIEQLESWSKKEKKPIYGSSGLSGYAAIRNGDSVIVGYEPEKYKYEELGRLADLVLQEVQVLFDEIQTRDIVAGDLGAFVNR